MSTHQSIKISIVQDVVIGKINLLSVLLVCRIGRRFRGKSLIYRPFKKATDLVLYGLEAFNTYYFA